MYDKYNNPSKRTPLLDCILMQVFFTTSRASFGNLGLYKTDIYVTVFLSKWDALIENEHT